MASIPYLYKRLRALGVPESLATKFSEQGDSLSMEPIDDLATDADLETAVAKINELLAAMRTAGMLDEEEEE